MRIIQNKRNRLGCIVTILLGMVISLIMRNYFGRTRYFDRNKIASAVNIEQLSGIVFPDYKVVKINKAWGFDGFEHKMSLRFKNIPDSLFYQKLYLMSSQTELMYDSQIEMPSQYWTYNDSVFLFHIYYEPNIQSSEYTRDYLRLMGFTNEQLAKRKISIMIKIPINQKKWFVCYSENI